MGLTYPLRNIRDFTVSCRVVTAPLTISASARINASGVIMRRSYISPLQIRDLDSVKLVQLSLAFYYTFIQWMLYLKLYRGIPIFFLLVARLIRLRFIDPPRVVQLSSEPRQQNKHFRRLILKANATDQR